MYLLRRIPVVAFLAVVGLASAVPTERSENTPNLEEPRQVCSLPRKDSVGDSIALNDDTVTDTRVRRDAYSPPRQNRRIFYYLHAKDFNATGTPLEQTRHRLFHAALARIVNYTCLNAIESMTAPGTFRVIDHRSKESCGLVSTGSSPIDQAIAVTCWGSPDHVLHEMFHAFGVPHTHSRPDRDEYVIVSNPTAWQYQKLVNMTVFVPYDYSSIVHYTGIPTKDPDYRYTLGPRFPSFFDILNLNLMYNCAELCPKETSAECKNGGYPNPKNCGVCNCPLGYGGPLCDQRPYGCGEILEATKNWQLHPWQLIPNHQREQLYFSEYDEIDTSFCTHWIKASEGSKLEVRIVEATGCIEVRYLENTTYTSPRYCSDKARYSKTVNSTLNPMPVVSWTSNDVAKFAIEYRIISDVEVVQVAPEIKEQFVFLEKNLNKVLGNEDKDAATRNIFNMYAGMDRPDDRKVKEQLTCFDDAEKATRNFRFGDMSFYWFFANYQMLNELSTRLKATSVESSGNAFEEKKEGENTAVTTKWTFKNNEKKMICDVTLLFGESPQKKYQLEKTTITCPKCLIQ